MSAGIVLLLAATFIASTVWWWVCKRRARRWMQLRPRDWQRNDADHPEPQDIPAHRR